MLTKNKKLTYAVILTFLVIVFIATSERACLREMLVAQEIYYRGEYLITTYYPAPYAQYQDLIAMGKVGIGTTDPNSNLHVEIDDKTGSALSSATALSQAGIRLKARQRMDSPNFGTMARYYLATMPMITIIGCR